MTLSIQDHFADPILDDLPIREIDIDNRGNSSELTDYQITVDVSNHVDQQGIRFVDENLQIVDYWEEDSNTIWAEIPKIVGSKTSAIRMIHGDVDSASDGDATFEFFDDFDYEEEQSSLKKWEYRLDEDDAVYYHFGIIKNGKYYCGNSNPPYRLQEWNVLTGDLLQYVSLEGQVCSAPFIVGDYIYIFTGCAGGTSMVYKILLSNFSIATSLAVGNNPYNEAVAFDDTYFYLAEPDKISKRNLSDLSEVDSFSCTNPRGVLRVGTMLYFGTPNGVFHAVNTSDMTESWNITLDITSSQSYCVPVYDATHDRLYYGDSNVGRTDGNVYSINPNTHLVDWKIDVAGGVVSTPVYYNNKLFISHTYNKDTTNGYHKALDVTNNGATIWTKHYYTDSAWGGFAADDNYLYLITKHNPPFYFLIINQSDGEIVHSEQVPFEKSCNTAVLSNGMCIIGTHGRLYGFEIGSGSAVDSLYYHCDQNYTGHISNAITSYYNFYLPPEVDTTKWEKRNTPTLLESNKLQCVNDEYVVSKNAYDIRGKVIETNCVITAGEDCILPIIGDLKSTIDESPWNESGQDCYGLRRIDNRGLVNKWVNGVYGGLWEDSTYFSGYDMGNKHGWKWAIEPSSPYNTHFWIEKTSWEEVYSENWVHASYDMYIYLGTRGTSSDVTSEWDFVLLRKYTSPEPTAVIA